MLQTTDVNVDLDTKAPLNNNWSMPGKMHNGTHYLVRDNTHSKSSSRRKEVVIFVHGIGSYHTCFNHLVDALLADESENYISVQYDLIGRGYSDPSKNGHYTADEHISQLFELLEHLRKTELAAYAQPFHFIAHSMGGSLVSIFAARYPQYVQSLILLTPAGLLSYFPVGLLVSCCSCFQNIVKSVILNDANQRQALKSGFYSHKGAALKYENECIEDLLNMNRNNPECKNALWKCVLEFPLRNIDRQVEEIGKRTDLSIFITWASHDKDVPVNPNSSRWEKLLTKQQQKKSKATTTAGSCYYEKKIYKNATHAYFMEEVVEANKDILNMLKKAIQNRKDRENKHQVAIVDQDA